MNDSNDVLVDVSLIEAKDEPFELELLRNPFSLKAWLRYLTANESSSFLKRVFLYERACNDLPGSYKLWKQYLELRIQHITQVPVFGFVDDYEAVNNCFRKALVLLHRFPVIWEMYLKFLMLQANVTDTRKAFDEALRALPVAQHDRIWELYKDYAISIGGPFCVHVLRRYVCVEPRAIEDFIEELVHMEMWNDAVHEYLNILNRPVFLSTKRKSNYQIWSEFSELLVKHPREIQNINVEEVLRAGIKRFTDQAGRLYTTLARYFIRMGLYEKARDIFMEGITTVVTVRDFTFVFDAAVEFEEQWVTHLMERAETNNVNDVELDFQLLRLENLLNQRPFYVNDVLLRQNVHNASEWQRRVELHGEDAEAVLSVYTKALSSIKPSQAVGDFVGLWTNFAMFFEKLDDLENARIIFEKATKVPFKSVNDLAQIWIDWAEMELRQNNFDRARSLVAQATKGPKHSTVSFFDESLSPQARLHKSAKLWLFYLDLEESVGTLESTRALYERMFELKIATPQVVVNYANLLEENQFFEDSFKVYERGVALFSYPVAFELWNLYLTKFVQRYKGQRLERARDLFEQALDNCPEKFAKPLYLLYAEYEETYGKARKSLSILEKASTAVVPEERKNVFDIWLVKATVNFGIAAARPIYEKAIEILPDAQVKEMCLRYAELEIKLGEIDRARAIFIHGSQYCDPRVESDYWEKWQDFEIKYGNAEETVKDMLRIKRSVLAKFNSDVAFIAKQAAVLSTSSDAVASNDAMEQLNNAVVRDKPLAGFVASSTGPQGGNVNDQSPSKQASPANPEEISLDI
ncbi:complexed with Cdc5 protein Cwf3 [Schizosaccharomyces japonicus yFS275]|uniref:Pre-mRNA-splicing factor SYF1 n=1 Tax=Schizosaccharomyces japonicus (strain yFS275 / FY16936) TaxID=402676 RepID=B6JWT4_SCHJY|nr:complexed with Cdc5 protein Cwf3 [Schizosaccharomyces japonicus yFS275]EEB05835.1 complexed with Cdc5 protein Cwf3 [Schizosaccharomyces japonicus yFS275]